MSDLELLYRGATFDSDLAGLNERAKADPTLARMLAGLIEYVQDSTYDDMDESNVPDGIRESIAERAVEVYMENYTCDSCPEEYDRGYTDGRDSRDDFECDGSCGLSPVHTLVPEVGSFIGFKKVYAKVKKQYSDGSEDTYTDAVRALAKVLIPEDAGRVCGSDGDKCRASKVITLEILREDDTGCFTVPVYAATGLFDPGTLYIVGQVTLPDSFNADPDEQCTHGIHFFLNREGAERY